MKYSFLLIGEETETTWSLILEQSLASLGNLQIVPEDKAMLAIGRHDYDLVIIDAGAVQRVAQLLSHLRQQRPNLRTIVATASPTWQRAREALQGGATDYIRKSLDADELHSKIKTVLQLPPPSGSH